MYQGLLVPGRITSDRSLRILTHVNAMNCSTRMQSCLYSNPSQITLRALRVLRGKPAWSAHKKCPTTANGRRARSWGTARSCNPVGCTGSAVQPLATVTIIGHRSPPFRRVTPTNTGVTHLPPGCLHSPASQGAHRPKTLRVSGEPDDPEAFARSRPHAADRRGSPAVERLPHRDTRIIASNRLEARKKTGQNRPVGLNGRLKCNHSSHGQPSHPSRTSQHV